MRRATAAIAVCSLALAGCGGGAAGSASGKRVTVFAAASLAEAFAAEARAYERATGDDVRLSLAGSQELVGQISNGAPADVVATADLPTIRQVADRLLAPPQVFARNRLVVVVPRDNPAHVTAVTDLARPDVTVVLAGPTVPAGHYAQEALRRAHVTVSPRSLEPDVRGVVTKVRLGEADAGIAYATDARAAAAQVTAIPVPDAPTASYAIGTLRAVGNGFVRFVQSPAGERILRSFGFLPP